MLTENNFNMLARSRAAVIDAGAREDESDRSLVGLKFNSVTDGDAEGPLR